MTNIDLQIENLVDDLLDKGVTAENVASAMNSINVEIQSKLLTRTAEKIEEHRLEKEAEQRPAEIRHLKRKMDSVYQNELYKRQSKAAIPDASEMLRKPASWREHVDVFGGDFSFVMKLAQRTLESPFPNSFIQFVADLRGTPFSVIEEYLFEPAGILQAEYSSTMKPTAPQKEIFSEALERSTVPEHLKQEWLEEALKLSEQGR